MRIISTLIVLTQNCAEQAVRFQQRDGASDGDNRRVLAILRWSSRTALDPQNRLDLRPFPLVQLNTNHGGFAMQHTSPIENFPTKKPGTGTGTGTGTFTGLDLRIWQTP